MDNSSRVIEVDINDILPNRNQPRIMLNEEDDLGLTDSVKEYGVLQPIMVRTIGDKYEIIAGERRYRASVLAGKETIPVIVRNMTDKESAEVALIENIQRKELTPIEEALSYKKILDLGYLTQEQLAEKMGKSQSTIANKMRLLNLTDEVQDALLENKISERHARSLLKIKNKQMQRDMLNRIINERLTVRRTDEEIDKLGNEKGEDKMNNNEFINMPQFDTITNNNIPTQPVETFATADVAPVADAIPASSEMINIFAADTKPTIEPVEQPVNIPQFDIFADAKPTIEPAATPANISQYDIFADAKPAIEPAQTPANISQYDIFANAAPTVEPEVQTPEAEFLTPVEPKPVPEIDSVINAESMEPVVPASAVNQEQSIEPIVVQASAVNQEQSIEPIVVQASAVNQEQSIEPIVVPATAAIQEQPVQEATTAPEPIIITDYNKQYDPIMPKVAEPAPQADFKEVIAAIRECANKIESYGYKIDVDEFDLTNIYQAIFKIEKM